jgi:hypothetical protein
MESQLRFSNISVILVDNLFEIGQFIEGQLNLITAEADLYRIESFFESNRYRIERFLQHLDRKSNRNQFDLTALGGGKKNKKISWT